VASWAARAVEPHNVRHARRVYSKEKIASWSEGDVDVVRICAAAIAAARKCPVARSVGSGVSGLGCVDEERNGAGVVR